MPWGLVFLVVWVGSIIVGVNIGRPKGRRGGWWGFWLGPIGVLLVALLPPLVAGARPELMTHRECPHCREPVRREASACPHCQRSIEPWVLASGVWWVGRDGKWERAEPLMMQDGRLV